MQEQNEIDFTKIEWSKIDKEKAEFFYNEAIARLDSIHKNNEAITRKALTMLSFSVPILTALIGYFLLQWETLTVPLQIISFLSGVFLFIIFILLLFVIVPEGLNTAQGEPSTYLSKKYYLNSMETILKGNIKELHKYIKEDLLVQDSRAKNFKIAVIIFAFFPFFLVFIYVMIIFCTKLY